MDNEQQLKEEIEKIMIEKGRGYTAHEKVIEALASFIQERERKAFDAGNKACNLFLAVDITNDEYYNQLMKFGKWSNTEQKLKDGQ